MADFSGSIRVLVVDENDSAAASMAEQSRETIEERLEENPLITTTIEGARLARRIALRAGGERLALFGRSRTMNHTQPDQSLLRSAAGIETRIWSDD